VCERFEEEEKEEEEEVGDEEKEKRKKEKKKIGVVQAMKINQSKHVIQKAELWYFDMFTNPSISQI
jgi:hypothetical protein